jgi:K+-sensing histidine kinase KdpD
MQRFLAPTDMSAQDVLPLITHDLRQPVTAIKGYSQLALRQLDASPRVNHLLSTIVEEVNHLAALLEDLALVSRIERGLLPIRAGPVNLGELVWNTVGAFANRQYDGEVAAASNHAEVEAHCDSALTQRALANMIRYSLKFSQQDRPMHVGPIGAGPNPAIWISADGADQASYPEIQPSPTGSSPPTKTVESLPVHDLSLFIATRLVELQGGQVWGEDRVRDGAGFLVLLPPSRVDGVVESLPEERR